MRNASSQASGSPTEAGTGLRPVLAGCRLPLARHSVIATLALVSLPVVAFGQWQFPAPRSLPLPDPPPREQDVRVDEPLFRAEVTRVEVSVLVTDADGEPVRGLRAEDFEIREDGKVQTIRSFVPYMHSPGLIALPDPVAVAADGERLAAPATNYFASASRVFALILDDLHVDVRRTRTARAAARRLVEQLEPSDLLFVMQVGSGESTGFFTRDRTHALEIIDGFTGQRLLDRTMHSKRLRVLANDSDAERLEHYRRMCERLREVSLALRSVRGRRKTLVLISEGSSYGANMADMEVRIPTGGSLERVNAGSGSMRLMNEVLAAAAAGNVAIYPLNPNGLDVPDADLIQVSGTTSAEYSALLSEARQAREMSRDLAALTGGVSLVDTNDALAGIDRAVADASTHYVLSYEPETPARGSEYRRVDVRVNRPGVRVLARRGYRAPGMTPPPPMKTPGSVSPQLRTLLAAVMPDDGLAMRVEAVPVARNGRQTRLAVIVEVNGALLGDRRDEGTIEMEQGLLTVDTSGKASNGIRRTFTLQPTPGQWDVLLASNLRTIWAVDLPAGRHQLRVAARDATAGRGGSVYLDVVVPKAPRWPAGALVASRFLSMMPTPFIDPRLETWTDAVPTATRVFPAGDVLLVTLPHDAAATSAHARLETADGRQVWQGEGEPMDGQASTRFAVPLDEMAGRVGTLVIDTSHGTQRIAVGVVR